FAQSIHNTSKRCDSPFIAINCSAIVENLLESEFFGYERGAFTGANKDGKQGIFELADGGTLFLDEIAEIPKHLQAKLLRVLQEKEIIRVGGEKIIPVDVRIISATNKDLYSMVEKGEFRMDLYYRLCVLPLEIPPLRERKEDIKGLLEHFIRTTNRKLEYTDEALNCILNYRFPGNIRELENCVEYLVSINKETIDYEDLPAQFKKASLNDFEIVKSLDENKCNIEKIANELNLNEIEIVILDIILESLGNGERIGRRKIKQILFENEIEISEYHIRKILKNLGEKGLLEFNLGRAGITFTHPI
ncbi:MAG: sigma 54-interacting transcriptional regulator, partial [Tissierellia bacterium]|nr:sigma 54-interacting transcriptional regulator [Tissierellia bacterium]